MAMPCGQLACLHAGTLALQAAACLHINVTVRAHGRLPVVCQMLTATLVTGHQSPVPAPKPGPPVKGLHCPYIFAFPVTKDPYPWQRKRLHKTMAKRI